MYRLYEIGIDGKLWKLIRDLYSGAECCVKIGGRTSQWFTISQGVHQGAPLSMLLFQIFMNPLIKELRSMKLGARICDINITCPTLADDLAIVALTLFAMQKMLNTCLQFSRRWRFLFNALKSYLLCYGKSNADVNVYLDGEVIAKVKSSKHVGTLLVTKGGKDNDFTETKIASARRCIYSFISLGNMRIPINPISATKVYKSMSLSRMLYGLEVADVSPNALKSLERTHWEVAKSIQGLNKSTPNPAVLPSVRWHSIENVIHKARIDFLCRILMLDANHIYKRVAIIRIYQCLYKQTKVSIGPVSRALQSATGYNMLEPILQAVESGGLCNIGVWKRNTKAAMEYCENKRWETTVLLYGNMNVYKAVMEVKGIWFWWKFSMRYKKFTRPCQLFLRLLSGGILHERDTDRLKCCLCDEAISDKTSHVLFTCEQLVPKREPGWLRVINALPPALSVEINRMSAKEKTTFLANGFNGTYTAEWLDIYINVITYVKDMYNEWMYQIDNA
jgi:hypothetical protein